MDIKLEPGQALVIKGPQGSGKNKLAQDLAAGFGKYGVLTGTDLFSPFSAVRFLEERPATLVVLETTREQLDSAHVKQLITNTNIATSHKNGKSEFIKAPRFIFCMREDEQWIPGADDRRFKVVRLGACDRP